MIAQLLSAYDPHWLLEQMSKMANFDLFEQMTKGNAWAWLLMIGLGIYFALMAWSGRHDPFHDDSPGSPH